MVMENANITGTNMGTYFYNDEAFNFEFITSLSASKKISFVNSVVDTIVGDNYTSIIKDMIFDYTLIQMFTNVDTTFINNSKDIIDSIEQFLNGTNIVDIVKVNMEIGLLEELNKSVDKAIEYRTGIHPSPIADALSSLLSTLEKKVNEFDMGSMMGMAQKFAGMTDEFNLDNLVKAYMDSDTHKNNLVEIKEAKRLNKVKKTKNNKKNELKLDENLDEAIRSVVKENKTESDSENDKN
jgi:hypothetical protein